MTFEELAARKRLDTDTMTDEEKEEKEARIESIRSHFGAIGDPSFKRYPDSVISTDTSYPVDESIDMDAVRERLISKTNSPRMKRILSHFGKINDPAIKRYPEVPVSSFVEEE